MAERLGRSGSSHFSCTIVFCNYAIEMMIGTIIGSSEDWLPIFVWDSDWVSLFYFLEKENTILTKASLALS